MNHSRITCSFAAALGCLGLAGVSLGQVGRTYHLRPPSSIQQGCFIGCACFTTLQEPLRGSFVMTPALPDPVFNNYTITSVDLRAPVFATQLVGAGVYQIGGDPAALDRMQLDMSLNAQPVQHWDSGYTPPTANFPAISKVLTINNYQCYDVVLTIHASPLRSDWNADGVLSVHDIFDFVNSWLAGDGDEDDNGQTNVADVFAFINDWFSGV
jgi:hypothetical protein